MTRLDGTPRLKKTVLAGALAATVLYFALALPLAAILNRPGVSQPLQGVGLTLTLFLPVGLAAWWVYRSLRGHLCRREARAVALTFGTLTPLLLAAGLLFGPIIGGYFSNLVGTEYRLVAVSAVTAWMVIVIAAGTFLASSIVLGITRCAEGSKKTR